MYDNEIRFKCLQLAQENAHSEGASQTIERARLYSDFVLGADDAQTRRKLQEIESIIKQH